MSLFEKIACCAEPYDLEHRAYSRALGFWKASGSAPGGLSAVAAESIYGKGAMQGMAQEDPDVRAPGPHKGWLEAWLEQETSDAASRRVLKSDEPSRELVALEHEWGTSMLVMAAGGAGSGTGFISDFKINMLRFSPAPVYLAQEPQWNSRGPVLVAMNVAAPENRAMRDMHKFLMRRAGEIASTFGSQIHIVTAVRPLSNPYPGDYMGLAPEVVGERLLRECRESIVDFASHYELDEGQCHAVSGIPEEVIPELCGKLKPSCLVMATSGRSGLAGSIIGNVPETVMRRVSCDLLIVPSKCLKYQKQD
jgi:nucleotide-binding universal stress UspA family protein